MLLCPAVLCFIPEVSASRQAAVVSAAPANKAVGDGTLWPRAFVAPLESFSDWLVRISHVWFIRGYVLPPGAFLTSTLHIHFR